MEPRPWSTHLEQVRRVLRSGAGRHAVGNAGDDQLSGDDDDEYDDDEEDDDDVANDDMQSSDADESSSEAACTGREAR